MQNGVPYYIFRPIWFFESLGMFVRNDKASVPGRLTDRYHWVATAVFAASILQPGVSGKIPSILSWKTV